jgi:CubicO group peptidase (beta-lactamase class C family)
LILYAFCLLQALAPQTPPPSTFGEINDTVVARFNRGDFKAIYQAGDDIYKGLNSERELVGGLERLVDLANHTSGINLFRFNKIPSNFETMTPVEALRYFDSYTNEDLLRDLHALTVDTIPGVRYHYSLGGINLLGMALAKVYNTTQDALVRDYYGKTFGMTDTRLISTPQDMTRYAKGYDDKGQLMPPMPEFTPSLYTVKSTTKDMIEYLKANVLENNPAIRLSHQQTWGDLKSFAVGLTWDMEDYYGRGTEIWHSGFDYGSITLLTAYPSLGFGMFLWANDDSRQGNLYDMERNIKENLEYLHSLKAR